MADPNDEGVGQALAKGADGCGYSTGYQSDSTGNPTEKTGRPDGTDGGLATPSGRRAGASAMRNGPAGANPTARTGRPDADSGAPQRSYARAKSGNQQITDVSAGTVRRSRA